jgi:hypothetical protein
MKFTFQSKWIPTTHDAFIHVQKYVTNPNAIRLSIHSESEGLLCVATSNIDNYIPEPGNVFIKNWSENEGVYEALLKANVIGPVIRKIPAGFTEAYECKLITDGES